VAPTDSIVHTTPSQRSVRPAALPLTSTSMSCDDAHRCSKRSRFRSRAAKASGSTTRTARDGYSELLAQGPSNDSNEWPPSNSGNGVPSLTLWNMPGVIQRARPSTLGAPRRARWSGILHCRISSPLSGIETLPTSLPSSCLPVGRRRLLPRPSPRVAAGRVDRIAPPRKFLRDDLPPQKRLYM
jgi:hypothetical protein